jgi:signal transduction histidine kinase
VNAGTVGGVGESRGAAHRLRVVRHELKNALSAASVHLELLASNAAPEIELDRIEAVRDALDQALGLSDRLADDAYVGSGARADIALVVRQCARLAQPLVERRGELAHSIPSYVGEIALGEVEAREVILNLLINAAQALVADGHVRVSARAEAGCAVVVVEDDGVGMSEEALERAFVPGFTSKPGGSGYGLARVKDLVQKLEGRIRIQSAPGRGTRIELELPLSHAPVR